MAISTSKIRVIFSFLVIQCPSFRVLLSLRLTPIFIRPHFCFLFSFVAFVGSSFGIRSNGLYDLVRRCFVLLYLKIVYAFQQQLHALLSALILILYISLSLFLSSFAGGSYFQFRLMALSYDPDIPISISMI